MMTPAEWILIWTKMIFKCAQKPPPEMSDAYLEDLQQFEAEVVEQACRAVILANNNPFVPALGAIYQECLRISQQTSEFVPAHAAWDEVLHTRWHPDVGGEINYSNALIEKAVKGIGGLYMVKTATQNEMVSHRAQFLSYYNQLVERARIDRISPKMLPTEQRPALNAGKQSVVKDITEAVTQRLTTK